MATTTMKPKKESPAPEPEPTPDPDPEGEPGEINSALASPRMQALLEDHRKMGARP